MNARLPNCSSCARLIASEMDTCPAEILEEMLRRTRIIGNAARDVIAAANQTTVTDGRLESAILGLSRALDEVNAFRNETPAECVVSTYLTLVRSGRTQHRNAPAMENPS